jgi:cephalosporin hydroxylase
MILQIDTDRGVVTVEEPDGPRTIPLADPDAFSLVSQAWLRAGWDVKHVYRFSWFGRPIIQLPEDIVRMQEAVYRLRPDVIVETGIAHGGSLVLFASLCEAMGHGRVVGVDIAIRPENRAAIESHSLFHRITLVEGDSASPQAFAEVGRLVGEAERVLILLDSDHSERHVLEELRLYSALVSVGSYIVVADGIMRDLAGAPRSTPEWQWNNPLGAIEAFLAGRDDFVEREPAPLFNEGLVDANVTYWPRGWLLRVR